jgi:hypothetical protein
LSFADAKVQSFFILTKKIIHIYFFLFSMAVFQASGQ